MKKEEMTSQDLFDLSRTIARELFEKTVYPWEVLPKIGAFILALGESLSPEEFVRMGKTLWIHKSVILPPTACIGEQVIICKGAQIRHCAFIRGNAIIGEEAVVGNSSEIKNSILFDGVQVPHYNYVGDSILGYKAHMGASSLASNVKSDKTLGRFMQRTGILKRGLRNLGLLWA